jgi:hypothetical protein
LDPPRRLRRLRGGRGMHLRRGLKTQHEWHGGYSSYEEPLGKAKGSVGEKAPE